MRGHRWILRGGSAVPRRRRGGARRRRGIANCWRLDGGNEGDGKADEGGGDCVDHVDHVVPRGAVHAPSGAKSTATDGADIGAPGPAKLTDAATRAAQPVGPIPARTPTGNCAIGRWTTD